MSLIRIKRLDGDYYAGDYKDDIEIWMHGSVLKNVLTSTDVGTEWIMETTQYSFPFTFYIESKDRIYTKFDSENKINYTVQYQTTPDHNGDYWSKYTVNSFNVSGSNVTDWPLLYVAFNANAIPGTEPQEYFCYYKENGVLKKVRPYVKSSSGLVKIKGVSKI